MRKHGKSGIARQLAKFTTLVLTMSMLLGTVASAKPITIKDMFDASYYSETYGDLAIFAGDAKKLYKHYVEHGQEEGRLVTPLIDLVQYRAANPDLEEAFGDDWDKYLNHYFEFGYKEGRESFGTFDAVAYADRYPDLKAAFGYDLMALYRHYMDFGRAEGRNAAPEIRYSGSSSSSSSSSDGNTTLVVDDREVVTRGRLVDPEDPDAVIPRAAITFTRIGDVFRTNSRAVTDNDPSGNNGTRPDVSGSDVVVEEGDTRVDNSDGSVTIYHENGNVTVYTGPGGEYTVPNLPVGEYSVTASATGYLTLTLNSIEIQTEGESFTIPAFQFLSASIAGNATISGRVIDATNAQAMADATIKVRADWGTREGSVISTTTTNSTGNYSIELARGYYTLEICKEGFASTFIDVFVSNASPDFNGELSPVSGLIGATEFRVVLTWGESPRDLDSHLVGPAEGGKFHVYFNNKNYRKNGELVASLDIDDTTSFGPETVTVLQAEQDKVYFYSVHDFTNGSNANSTAMSASGAVVKVFQGNRLVKTFNVPEGQTGNVWNVFKVVNGQVVTINSYNSSYDSIYGTYGN